MKFLLLILSLTFCFSVQAQTKEERKAIELLESSGLITAPEAKIMATRAAINQPSEIKTDVKEAMQNGQFSELFKLYLEANKESLPSSYSSNSPSELNLSIITDQFWKLLEGFIPFVIDVVTNDDVPKKLAIFKWVNYGKDIYRSNPDLRAKF